MYHECMMDHECMMYHEYDECRVQDLQCFGQCRDLLSEALGGRSGGLVSPHEVVVAAYLVHQLSRGLGLVQVRSVK
jgi:hypothetical protein